MLQVILMHADQSFIDEVFGEIKLSNDLLKDVAGQCRVGLYASTIHLSSQAKLTIKVIKKGC